MVQELKQSTAIVVHIGPFVDVGDGFTPEVAVTLSGADEAEALKHAATITTSISGLTFTAITGCDGWYRLSLGTGETDTLGQLEVIVQDDSVCLPVHVRFSVVTANYWDSKYSTDVRQVDVTQWLGATAVTPTVAGVPEVDITHADGTPGAVNTIVAGIGPQQNQVFSDLEFLMVLSSDGQTPATGLTVTGERSLNGGAFAAVTGTIAEVSDGIYQIDASAADMNAAVITFRFSSATALDTFILIKTTPA